jgi:hypothetical protein
MSVHSHHVLAVLTLAALLSGCSNGRGSVGEAGVGTTPPPSVPTPIPEPTPDPTPAPAEPPPSPAPTPPEPTPTPSPTPTPPPPPAPTPEPEGSALAGYWKGRVTDEDSGRERNGVALVDLSGDLQLLVLEDGQNPEFVLHGTLCCEPKADGKVDAHRYLETRDNNVDLEMESSNRRLTGKFKFRGRDYEFNLSPDDVYREGLTLQSLAGVYTRTTNQRLGPPLTLTLTINANGTVSGSHSNGCVFGGSASIPNASRNMVLLNIELTDCGSFQSSRRWNGEYRGLGVLLRNATSPTDGSTREDIFYHSLVGPTWFGPFDVAR